MPGGLVGNRPDVGVVVDPPAAGCGEALDEADVGGAVDELELLGGGRGCVAALAATPPVGGKRGFDRGDPLGDVGMLGAERARVMLERGWVPEVERRLRQA